VSSLFGSLAIALRSLLARQGAFNTTANNLSNLNTLGYSRQLAILTEFPPRVTEQISIGNEVDFEGVQSVRDYILELLIDEETQQQNRLKSFVSSMNQVQSLFNETEGAGLSDAINRCLTASRSFLQIPPMSLRVKS